MEQTKEVDPLPCPVGPDDDDDDDAIDNRQTKHVFSASLRFRQGGWKQFLSKFESLLDGNLAGYDASSYRLPPYNY